MMNNFQTTIQIESPEKKFNKSFLLALLMMLLTFVPMTRLNFSTDPLTLIPAFVPYIFANILFFLMLYTTKTDKYRAILFIAMAISFPVGFILNLYEARGHFMILTYEDMVQGHTPFCHIVIPQTLLPAIIKKEIIFPGSISKTSYSMGGMIVMWLGISLVLGRAWCGWVCFWGGWEDGFARLRKKLKIKNIDRKWIYFPFALLLAIVLISAVTLSPQYCWWLCPFKAVSEFVEVSSSTVVIQTVIFFALFLGLVIILPILTKRRTQCSFLCPFGAMQSLTNKISPFDIRIDTEKCADCKNCIQTCPVFSMNEDSLKTGRSNMTCMRCGKCMDSCSKGAITYHIKGTPLNVRSNVARMLFLYSAFSVLAIMGGGMIGDALYRLLLLATTGSIVR